MSQPYCTLRIRSRSPSLPEAPTVHYLLRADPASGGVAPGVVRLEGLGFEDAGVEVDVATRDSADRLLGTAFRVNTSPSGGFLAEAPQHEDSIVAGRLARSLSLLVRPEFPREPVGIGARWQVTWQVEGLQTQVVYQLTGREGQEVSLAYSLEQRALVSGALFRAGDVLWTGEGSVRAALDRFWPQTARLRLASSGPVQTFHTDGGIQVTTAASEVTLIELAEGFVAPPAQPRP